MGNYNFNSVFSYKITLNYTPSKLQNILQRKITHSINFKLQYRGENSYKIKVIVLNMHNLTLFLFINFD